jgi:hypothetical protein
MAELQADSRYVDVTVRRYVVSSTFAAERYLDLMSSVSRYRILAEEARTALFEDVAAAFERPWWIGGPGCPEPPVPGPHPVLNSPPGQENRMTAVADG